MKNRTKNENHRRLRSAYKHVEEQFVDLKDYRRAASTSHQLSHIIFMTLCGVISGANNLKEVAEYAKDMEEWFAAALNLEEGVPSYATFWLVFKHLNPEPLSKSLINWVQSITERLGNKTIAIDGKAQKGTTKPGQPNSFVHIVSAWVSEVGLILGQKKVDGKSNEIKAIPELLELIDIKGSVVTIDAMGTQKEIAKKLIDKGADYILALKNNQSKLRNEAVNYADQAKEYGEEGKDFNMTEQGNKSHGRIENRKVFATEKN